MLAEKNPMIREAYCKLQMMSEDEASRMLYEARIKAQRDGYSRVQIAYLGTPLTRRQVRSQRIDTYKKALYTIKS
jgi:hypothetical protein